MRILIVDDEANIRKSLRIALESMKNTVEEAGSSPDALERLDAIAVRRGLRRPPAQGRSGFDLLETFTPGVSPRLAVVIITAYASIDTAVDAMRRGAFDYLPKPFTPAQIRAVLERFERVRLAAEPDRRPARADRRRRPRGVAGSDDPQVRRPSWNRAARSRRPTPWS